MKTLTLRIPDDKFLLVVEDLNKYDGIEIITKSGKNPKRNIEKDLLNAVNEVNLMKKGLLQGQSAWEMLDEL